MRLHLEFPPPWRVQQGPNDQLAAILPGAPGAPNEAIVTYGPIVVKPDEPRPWLEQVVRFDAPAGAKIDVGNVIGGVTTDGWPLQMVDAHFVDAKGTPVESRWCALYTFMEHAAVAIARTANRVEMTRHTEAIVAVLERGRPDWRGEPICVAELFDLPASEPTPDVADASARFAARDFSGALALFQAAAKAAPRDLHLPRKVIECLYALERYDEGDAARLALHRAIAASTDPRARLEHEYVFDKFDGDGFTVHAYETLRALNPSIYPVLVFRAHDGERALPAEVIVETSDAARAAGAPFVLVTRTAAKTELRGSAKQLPPYAELKRDVLRFLGEVMQLAELR